MKSAAQENIAVTSAVTITWDTERFDQGNNFASNTFTAPVTGKYHFDVNVDLLEVDSANDNLYIRLITSNKNYYIADCDVDKIFSADTTQSTNFAASVLADMDAGDTAYVNIYLSTGAQQTDITVSSYFSGYLAL